MLSTVPVLSRMRQEESEMIKLPQEVERVLDDYSLIFPLDARIIRAHYARQQEQIDELKRDIFQLYKQEKQRIKVSAIANAEIKRLKVERDEFSRELNVSGGYVFEEKKRADKAEHELAVMRRACTYIDRARAEQESERVIPMIEHPHEPSDPSITAETTTNAEGDEYMQMEPSE